MRARLRRTWPFLLLFGLVVGPIVALRLDTAEQIRENGERSELQNVASRQMALTQRYGLEVILEINGETAEVDRVAAQLRLTAEALIDGGEVEGLRAATDTDIVIAGVGEIGGASGERLRAEFLTCQTMLEELIAAGDRLRATEPGSVDRSIRLQEFRDRSDLAAATTRLAAAALTSSSVNAIDDLLARQVLLGVAGFSTLVVLALVVAKRTAGTRDRRYRALIEQGADFVAIASASGKITYASPGVERLVGGSARGRKVAGLFFGDDVHAADLFASALPHRPAVREGRALGRDGSIHEFEVVVTNLVDDPYVNGLVVNAHDITERKRLERELTRQAFEDDLTGLPNRPLLIDRLNQAVARAERTGGTLGLLFVDLDGFKLVNDSLGHAVGDDLLRVVAQRLRRCVRPGDTIARLGGDEFAILLDTVTGRAEVEAVAAAIVAVLDGPCEVGLNTITARASVGAVLSEGAAMDADMLLRNADVAMYAAKAAGRGRHRFFEPEMHTEAVRLQQLASELRSAVDHNQLTIAYQPIIAAGGASPVAVEALVRWESPTLGPIPPTVFVPLAESTGLIEALGLWVLRNACREARRWHDDIDGCRVGLHVNVSALQLRREGFVADVAKVLDETGFPAGLLTLELTESVFAHETSVISHLEQVRRLGVRISIDDFGSGYSSLGQLQRLPIDAVKIDKSFIDRLGSPQGDAMLSGILDLAGALGLSVTAEGVETEAQFAHFRSAKGVQLQGFLFSYPLGDLAISEFLARPSVGLSR